MFVQVCPLTVAFLVFLLLSKVLNSCGLSEHVLDKPSELAHFITATDSLDHFGYHTRSTIDPALPPFGHISIGLLYDTPHCPPRRSQWLGQDISSHPGMCFSF